MKTDCSQNLLIDLELKNNDTMYHLNLNCSHAFKKRIIPIHNNLETKDKTNSFEESAKLFFIRNLKEMGQFKNIANIEFNYLNGELSRFADKNKAFSYLFDTTEDPSLHFTIRFQEDILLIVETFIDEEEIETFATLFKNKIKLLNINNSINIVLHEVQKALDRERFKVDLMKNDHN
ncbi:MAG: hypothetical protein WAT79_11180 [Saprospiraceae bacterium]